MLCNSALVTQRSRQRLPRVSVLTSLSFGITEPLQSFSCGYLRLRDRYMVSEEWLLTKIRNNSCAPPTEPE